MVLPKIAREKFYVGQILPQSPLSEQGTCQFCASRFSGVEVHTDHDSVGDWLALLRQARGMKLTCQLDDELAVDILMRAARTYDAGMTARALGKLQPNAGP